MPNMPPGIFPESGLFKATFNSRIPATHTLSTREETIATEATLRGATISATGKRLMVTIKIDATTAQMLTFP